MPENWIGVSTDLSGVIKPTKAVSMYQSLAFRNGAMLRDNLEVSNIVKDEVRGGLLVLATNGERFWAKKYVVTTKAWSTKLVKRVSGLELPIQPLETTMCYWRINEGHESEFAIGDDFPTFATYGDPNI